eukprot:4109370-Pleurochrysis_carterae.AAC.2
MRPNREGHRRVDARVVEQERGLLLRSFGRVADAVGREAEQVHQRRHRLWQVGLQLNANLLDALVQRADDAQLLRGGHARDGRRTARISRWIRYSVKSACANRGDRADDEVKKLAQLVRCKSGEEGEDRCPARGHAVLRGAPAHADREPCKQKSGEDRKQQRAVLRLQRAGALVDREHGERLAERLAPDQAEQLRAVCRERGLLPAR